MATSHETFGRVVTAGVGITAAAVLAFVADLSTMDPGIPLLGWLLVVIAGGICTALSRLRWAHDRTRWVVVAVASSAPALVATALIMRTWRALSA